MIDKWVDAVEHVLMLARKNEKNHLSAFYSMNVSNIWERHCSGGERMVEK